MNSLKQIITITPQALRQLANIQKEYQKKYIAFGIKSGGCSGFKYYLEPCDNKPEKIDEIIEVEDIKLKVCGSSVFKLFGAEIGWEDNIMGKQFVFNNPQADIKCGCGSSFG
tara:strand:- start:105 stop:440 length:336 start_codon:yes stop_codon:yes gene_type:complete